MNTKAENEVTAFDTFKLALAAAVLVGSIVAYTYYSEVSTLLRAIGLLLAMGASVAIVLQTVRGQQLWRFVQGSRVEMRKVVWPTREEAIQTTIAVLIFTLLMGVFFWLLDLFLLWCTRLLTGVGG
jgi:preprotein translocase subunit SecE